jgi:hypothetical protein
LVYVKKVMMFTEQTARQDSDRTAGPRGKEGGGAVGEKAKEFVDRMLQCRFEMKYVITESKAEVLRQFLKPYIQPDRYSKLQRGGWYPIVSLYLDSPDLRLCRETLTGQKNRFKLRIRSYTDEPDYPRFVEIKRRINNVILKSRSRVMERDVEPFLAGVPLAPQNFKMDIEALNQFQLYVRSINARPMVLIRYLRQAYESDSENRVRITFDRELFYSVTAKPEVRLGGTGWETNFVTVGFVILEIKFTGCYPRWLSRMVEYLNLLQRPVSKYVTSMQQASMLRFCAPQLGGIA